MIEQKINSWIAFGIIFLIILPTAWICYSKWKNIIQEIEQTTNYEYNILRK